MMTENSTVTNPRCHGNEIWDQMGFNSACILDIREIFVYNSGFRGRAIQLRKKNSTVTNPRCHPRCHGNEIWDTVGNKSLKYKI